MNDILKALLAKANKGVLTPREEYERRVSFIWGSCILAESREQIKKYLAEVGIHDPEAT